MWSAWVGGVVVLVTGCGCTGHGVVVLVTGRGCTGHWVFVLVILTAECVWSACVGGEVPVVRKWKSLECEGEAFGGGSGPLKLLSDCHL